MTKHGDIRIGVSGWTYKGWRGEFYPRGVPQKRELSYAASIFNALEINGTFYGLQTPQSFKTWAAAVPEDFTFAVKGSRYISHMLRLRDPKTPLANFFASGPLALGPKLGPVLWQFPPNFKFDAERLEAFFALLPKTTAAAAQLGRRHDERLRARAYLRGGSPQPLRHAMEIRHDSFRDPAFIRLLRKYRIALVCADTVDWPRLMDLTADFVYCRLHGSVELYNSGYTDSELDTWAKRIRAWSSGRAMHDGELVTKPLDDGKARDIFLFFDNTDKLQAPGNAIGLMERLGIAKRGSQE
jgi:uncharacterized protein YecE (DUF72 family)